MTEAIAVVGDFLGWWTSERVTALAALLTLLVAAVTARLAIRQLRHTVQDSEERSRPMVAAEFRRHPYSKGNASLVIKNYGPSIAKNVSVSFSYALPTSPRTSDGHPSVTRFIVQRYKRPIPSLPPGAELSNLYYLGVADDAGRFHNREDVPDQITVSIRYSSEARPSADYRGVFHLDHALLEKETWTESSESPEAQLREAVKTIKSLDKSTTLIAGSLKVITENGLRLRTKAADLIRERAQRHQDREDETWAQGMYRQLGFPAQGEVKANAGLVEKTLRALKELLR